MGLDASDVATGAKQAKASLQDLGTTAEEAGNQAEQGFSQLLAPLMRISKQLSRMGASLSELTGLTRQNGTALEDMAGKLSHVGTAAAKAESGTKGAGRAVRDTESDLLDMASASVQSSQEMAALTEELQTLKDHKKALESRGFGLGYQDYDQTAARIKEINTLQKEYEANLSKPVTVQVDSARVDNLTAKLKQAKANLSSLEKAGFGLGDANYDAQYQEVAQLTQAVNEYKAGLTEVADCEPLPRTLSGYLRGLTQGFAEMGKAALSAAGNVARFAGGAVVSGVKRLWSGLKNVGSHLLNVGSRAKASTNGLNGMVKSIRNIGLVSVGLKLVSSLFGRLRSVVSQYLTENAAAQTAVNNLKSAFANALAPAINIAINALNAILPYIQAVSNAFATLFTNLFGAQWTTISGGASGAADAVGGVADATKGAAAAQEEYNRTLAGFDQITKLDDSSSSGGSGGSGGGSGGGGATTSTIGGGEGLLGQFSQFMEDVAGLFQTGQWAELGTYLAEAFGSAIDTAYSFLTSQAVYEKIGSAVSALSTTVNSFFARLTLIDTDSGNSIAEKTGATLGAAINLAFYTVNSFLTSINWGSIGLAIAQFINGAVKETDWSQIGTTIANWFLTLPKILYSAIVNTDWGAVAGGLSEALISACNTASDWVKSVDWNQIATVIEDGLAGVNWSGIATALFDLLGSALGGIGAVIGQLVSDAMNSIGDYFSEWIDWGLKCGPYEDIGSNIMYGIFAGIGKAVLSLGSWIVDNVFNPFVDGFKSAFGIHSPASNPEILGLGKNILLGILNGILEGLSGIGEWVSENVMTPLVNAFSGARDDIIGVFDGIGDWFENKFEDAYGTATDAWSNAKKGFTKISGNVVEGFKKLKSNVESKFESAFKTAQSVWGTAKSKFSSIRDNVVSGFSTLATNIKSKFSTAYSNAQNAWNTAKSGFTTIANNVVSGFSTLATNIKSKFSTAYTNAQSAWSTAKSTFTTVATNVVNGFSNLASDVKSKFSSAFSQAKSVAENQGWSSAGTAIKDSILSGLSNWASGAKKAASGLWSSLQSAWGNKSVSVRATISKKLSMGDIIKPGSIKLSNASGSSVGTIKAVAYARGGIVDAATLFGNSLVGEDGKEAIIPLERHTEWIDKVASRMAQKEEHERSGGSKQPITLNVYIGGEKMTTTVIDDINRITRQTGACPIYV